MPLALGRAMGGVLQIPVGGIARVENLRRYRDDRVVAAEQFVEVHDLAKLEEVLDHRFERFQQIAGGCGICTERLGMLCGMGVLPFYQAVRRRR